MKSNYTMKNNAKISFLPFHVALVLFMGMSFFSHAQSTSWKGITNSTFTTASNWTNGVPDGTIDVIVGDANFTGASMPTISGTAACKSLTIGGTNASTVNLSGDLTVNSFLLVNSNGTISSANGSITIQGDWTNNGTYTATNSNASVIFAGLNQTIGGTTATIFRKLKINAGSNITLTNNISTSGGANNLQLYGTLNPGMSPSFAITASSTFTVFNAGVLKVNASTFAGNYPTVTLSDGSIVEYSSTAINQTVAALSYSNLIISGNTIKTLAANLPALVSSAAGYGNIYVNSGTLDLSTYTANRGTTVAGGIISVSNGASLKIGGTNTFPANYLTPSLSSASNVEFNGTAQVVSSKPYGNLILSSSLGAALKTFPASTLTITGNLTSNLGTGSSVSFTAAGNINVNGTVSIGASTTFIGGSYTHNFKGAFTNDGTIASGGILNFIPTTAASVKLGNGLSSTGTIKLGGNAAITLPASTPTSLNNVIISNTNLAGITPLSNWNINNDFTIADSAIFNAGSNSYNIAGNVQLIGTTNGGTSIFILSGPANTISASYQRTQLYDLVITGVITAQSDLRVAHDFTNHNSYNGTIGTIEFNGSLPSVISGSAFPFMLSKLKTTKSANAVTTLNANITGVNLLDIKSGVFNMGSYSITGAAGSTLMKIDNSAVLKIGGTNSLPVFTAYNIDTLATVEYAGTIQTIASNVPYGNLTLSSAGTKAALAPIHILNDFKLLNASFVPGNYIDTLGGNWNMSSGTYINTGNTIYMNGRGKQTITSSDAFNNIKLNKPSGNDSLLSNITVNGNLNFVKGRISTGGFSVIIPAAATLTGAAQSTGWIDGKLQKYVATGINDTVPFETGDRLHYTPSTVVFTSVLTAGNLTESTIPSKPQNIYLSGIDVTKGVNRYHSFNNSGVVFTTASVGLNWDSTDVDAGANSSSFLSKKYNGSAWIVESSALTSPTSLQLTGVGSLADFVAGEPARGSRWTGTTDTLWNIPENWNQGVPLATYDITIPTGLAKYPTLISGVTSVNNINIEAGASLGIKGGKLRVAGDFSNNGNLNAINGTIEFNGSAAQVITAGGSSANAIGNLIVNNSSITGLTLGGATDIYSSLIFTGTGKTLATAGLLTLKSTALQTARLGNMTGNTITGAATIERYINIGTAGHSKSWLLLSTPTSGQSIFNSWMEAGAITAGYGTIVTHPLGVAAGYDRSSPATSIKTYISATNTFDNGPSNTNNAIDNTRGYFIYVRGDRTVNSGSGNTATTLRTKGILYTPANPPASINIAANAYETVGNPYASQIDFSLLNLTGGVDNKFYAWDPALYGSYGAGGYQTISAVNNWIAVPGGGNYNGTHKTIESGQAVFVHSTGSAGTIGFTEAAKTDSSILVNRPANPGNPAYLRTSLYTVDGILADGNAVVFDDNFSNAVDADDAQKMLNGGENFGLKRAGITLAIEARATITGGDSLQFFMTNIKQAAYRLVFVPENMDPTRLAFLQDNFTGGLTPVSLEDSSIIDFTVTANPLSSASNRFSILFSIQGPVPVTITHVTAKRNPDKTISITWAVENEINIRNYSIERSANGTSFAGIASVIAAHNSVATGTYTYIDMNASTATHYYRIKSIECNGSGLYSPTVKVQPVLANPGILVYPNPIEGKIMSVQFTDMPTGIYQLELTNSLGQIVYKGTVRTINTTEVKLISLENAIQGGNYQLNINADSIVNKTIKVVIL